MILCRDPEMKVTISVTEMPEQLKHYSLTISDFNDCQ